MRKRDVAADEAAVEKILQERIDCFGPDFVADVIAVDPMLTQPIAVDQRRARMRDRIADDAGTARHDAIIPALRKYASSGRSGMPRIVK